jgi:hypothetical protein
MKRKAKFKADETVRWTGKDIVKEGCTSIDRGEQDVVIKAYNRSDHMPYRVVDKDGWY